MTGTAIANAAQADSRSPATRDARTTTTTCTETSRTSELRRINGPSARTPRQPIAPTTEPGLPTPPTRPTQATRATDAHGPAPSPDRREITASAATGRSAPTTDRACSVSGTVPYTPSEENAIKANESNANRPSRISPVGVATNTAANTRARAQPGVPDAASVTSTTPPGSEAAAETVKGRPLAARAPAATRRTATSSAPGSTPSAAKPAKAPLTAARPRAADRIGPRAKTTASSATPLAVNNATTKPELSTRALISPALRFRR